MNDQLAEFYFTHGHDHQPSVECQVVLQVLFGVDLTQKKS